MIIFQKNHLNKYAKKKKVKKVKKFKKGKKPKKILEKKLKVDEVQKKQTNLNQEDKPEIKKN